MTQQGSVLSSARKLVDPFLRVAKKRCCEEQNTLGAAVRACTVGKALQQDAAVWQLSRHALNAKPTLH